MSDFGGTQEKPAYNWVYLLARHRHYKELKMLN